MNLLGPVLLHHEVRRYKNAREKQSPESPLWQNWTKEQYFE